MDRHSRAYRGFGWLLYVVLASCTVDVTGAPCETDDNCPSGQYCSSERVCALGAGGGADGGERDAGGTSDAGHGDIGPRDAAGGDVGQADSGRDGGGDVVFFDGGRDGGRDGGGDGGGDSGHRDAGDGGTDAGCKDECNAKGALECTPNNGYHVCDDWDNDGCLEWGKENPCSLGCKDGKCLTARTSISVAYGGPDSDWISALAVAKDGSLYAVGSTTSFGAADRDIWVMKFSAGGAVGWQKVYGGDGYDDAYGAAPTAEGGVIVAGTTKSFGLTNFDAWVLKIRPDGSIEWQLRYGGLYDDEFRSIRPTKDGGYILAGITKSFGAGRNEVWVLKIKADGEIEWEHSYGSTGDDAAYAVVQTADDGYAVAGYTDSSGAGYKDVVLIKLGTDGVMQWAKTYGGGGDEVANAIARTVEGGYLLAGYTNSFKAQNGKDMWLIKTDDTGAIVWQHTYGGVGDDVAYALGQASGGGYLVAGATSTFGAGSYDAWILKVAAADGAPVWQKTYGGPGLDGIYDLQALPAGGIVTAGELSSFGTGSFDGWIMKMDANGVLTGACPKDFVKDTNATAVTPTGVVTDEPSFPTSGYSAASIVATSAAPRDVTADTSEQCPP